MGKIKIALIHLIVFIFGAGLFGLGIFLSSKTGCPCECLENILEKQDRNITSYECIEDSCTIIYEYCDMYNCHFSSIYWQFSDCHNEKIFLDLMYVLPGAVMIVLGFLLIISVPISICTYIKLK